MAGKPTWKDLKRYFLEQGDDRENEEFAELIVNLTGHNPEKDSRRVDLRVQTKQLLSGFPDEEIANWYPPALAEVVISAEPGQDMLKKHVQTLREQLAEAEASAEEAKTNAARLASKLDICTKARKDLQDRIDKLEPALEESERKLRECGRQNETLKGEKQQLTEANTALHNRLDQMGTRRPEEEREIPAFLRRREPTEPRRPEEARVPVFGLRLHPMKDGVRLEWDEVRADHFEVNRKPADGFMWVRLHDSVFRTVYLDSEVAPASYDYQVVAINVTSEVIARSEVRRITFPIVDQPLGQQATQTIVRKEKSFGEEFVDEMKKIWRF